MFIEWKLLLSVVLSILNYSIGWDLFLTELPITSQLTLTL